MEHSIPTLAIIPIAVAAVVFVYNQLMTLQHRVEDSWQQIDVQLKRRHELILRLVDAITGGMRSERATLASVMQARSRAAAARSIGDRLAAEEAVTQALGRLYAAMERCPALGESATARWWREELLATEKQIAYARQFYNDVVLEFNSGQRLFPFNLIAALFAFKPAELFAAVVAEHAGAQADVSLSR